MKKFIKIIIFFIIILLILTIGKNFKGDTNIVSPLNQSNKNNEVVKVNENLIDNMNLLEKDIEVIIKLKENWKKDWKNYYNYEIVIKNNSYSVIKNWQLVIKNVKSKIEISQVWNGEFNVIEQDIVIDCLDYNSKIEANSQITIGFIFSSKDKVELNEYELYKNIDLNKELVLTNNMEKMQNYIENNKIKIPKNSPLDLHGMLSVKNGKIIDKNKNEFLIQGISTHSIYEFSQYINYETFKTLRDEFNVNTIRLAMYPRDEMGYSESLHSKMDEGIKYATELGMYVIVDWHILEDNDPNINKESAKIFFKEMAYKYRDYDNVIYEICNEPNGDVTWDSVKAYAIEIIGIIRELDNDGIIIIGTPDYCKNINDAQNSPIEQYDNLLYSFHFYAGTHKGDLREKLEKVVNNNFPVIVSEFGISEATGSGNIDEEEANRWLNYLKDNKIGYICWNLSNKDESSAILKPGVVNISAWNDEELSQTGLWLKKIYK